jgi:hypothetical protein
MPTARYAHASCKKQWYAHKHSDQTQGKESPYICNKNNKGEKNTIYNQTPKKNTVLCIFDKLHIMDHCLLCVFPFWSDLLLIPINISLSKKYPTLGQKERVAYLGGLNS